MTHLGLTLPLYRHIDLIKVFARVDHNGSPGALAVIIDKHIAHHRKDPSLEVGALHILVFIVECLKRSVLHEIFRIIAVEGKGIGKVEQICL